MRQSAVGADEPHQKIAEGASIYLGPV